MSGGYDEGDSFALFFSFPFWIVLLLLVVAIIGFRRGEPDATGRRPYAIYLFVVIFVSLFALLFSTFAMVDALANLAFRDRGDDSSFQTEDRFEDEERFEEEGVIIEVGDPESADNADGRDAVLGLAIGGVALAVLLFHKAAAKRLINDPEFPDTPGWGPFQVYLYVTCFVSAVIAAGAGVSTLYGIFGALAPGVADEFNDQARREGLVQMFSSAILTLGALAVFRYHWRRGRGWWDRRYASPAPPPEPPQPA